MSDPDNPSSSAAGSGSSEQFLGQLTGAQSSLYAFICSLLGGSHHAQDVLQETNLVLWKKAPQFDASREFLPWAFTFARNQVLAHRKRSSRNRLQFSDELLDMVAQRSAARNSNMDDRMRALDGCLAKLPERQREMIRRRYADAAPVGVLAAELKQSANALAVNLHRIRAALLECVQRAVARGGVA